MKKNLLLIPLALLLAISLVAIGCPAEETTTPTTTAPTTTAPTTTAPPEPKMLKVGSLIGVTGWASAGTKLLGEGCNLGAEMLNEQGGITVNGQQYLIELIEVDDECTSEGAVAGATKLVYEDEVKYIALGAMANINAAIATVTEPAGVLHALNWNCAMPSEIGPDTPYTFGAHPGTISHCTAVIKYLSEAYPEVKTVELLMQDDGSIEFLFPKLQALCAQYGITTTEPVAVPHDAVDFVPITTKAINRNPDAICVVNGWPLIFGSILKAAREMNWDKPVAISSGAAGDVSEVAGLEASTNCICCGLSSGDYPEITPLMKEIVARSKDKWGYFLEYHLLGYQTIWSLMQAIEAAQSLEPDVIKDVWENMDTIETIYGTGHMGGLETIGINHIVCCPLPVEKMVDGEVVFAGWSEVVLP